MDVPLRAARRGVAASRTVGDFGGIVAPVGSPAWSTHMRSGTALLPCPRSRSARGLARRLLLVGRRQPRATAFTDPCNRLSCRILRRRLRRSLAPRPALLAPQGPASRSGSGEDCLSLPSAPRVRCPYIMRDPQGPVKPLIRPSLAGLQALRQTPGQPRRNALRLGVAVCRRSVAESTAARRIVLD